jgi:hypothetical protein
MHYRSVSCSSDYFQVDHPENAKAQQWIGAFMKAKGIQSAVETWLCILRYYLDTPHSDIMRDAAEVIDKYGVERLAKMMAESHIPPDLEHYPAFTYQCNANSHFLSIWEAAEGEEFILTHNGFGLWEGLAVGFPGLHRIFVVSPRIAIVLRSGLLRPELQGHVELGFSSSLLDVYAAPATPIYADGGDGLRANFTSATSLARYRSSHEGANDSFVFKITKLSRPQTLELNSVALLNVKERGSLTFLSRESMLRTTRAFRRLPSNLPESDLVVPLIECLTATTQTESSAPRPPLQSRMAVSEGDTDPLSYVDVALYMLLMEICTGRKQFPSAYDRAYLVLTMMEKGNPTSFAREIGREVEKAFRVCKEESEDVGSFAVGARFAPLLSSIPDKLSCQLFHLMIPYMCELGAVMSGGEGILEELQDQVAVVSFLTRASCNPGVWHTLSCSSPEVPKILSGLFQEDTPADEFVATFAESLYNRSSAPVFSSWYDRAYTLRSAFGMAGPTTNPASQEYYHITAAMIQRLVNLTKLTPGSERPKARLVRTMSKRHSDLLMSNMETILQLIGYQQPSEDTRGQNIGQRIGEMAIVNTIAWLGKHRRDLLDCILNQVPLGMNFKLFEDEGVTGST